MRRLVIIGGGPAGLEAARAAAPHATVTLVSTLPPGAWRPLVSRVWLAAAADGVRDLPVIAARAERAATAWQERAAEELAALEVTVLAGRACLDGPGAVLVEPSDGGAAQQLAADAVIIAAGALDAYPEGLTTDGVQILSDGDLGALSTVPTSALVIGDGTIGFELCHILSLLGTAVTWLVPNEAPHNQVAPAVDGYLTRQLERQGVQVAARAPVRRLSADGDAVHAVTTDGARYGASVALLARSRRNDHAVFGLPAEKADTDIYGQTRLPGVYLVGDALRPRTTGVAMAQARAAALHALGRSSAPADTDDIVISFMQRPQVALLGHLATEGAHGSVTVALSESLAAYVDDATDGFLNLAWDHGGRVAGALAVAPGAAALLAPLALAMRLRLRLEDLADGYGPHPALSELVALAARKALM
jgi:pyruvate/2-oxoglutarate dehydrogenase complex dihydrolipoamide dehydrogenase (E3) component